MSELVTLFSRDGKIHTGMDEVEGIDPKHLERFHRFYFDALISEPKEAVLNASLAVKNSGYERVEGFFRADLPRDNFWEQWYGQDWNEHQGLIIDLTGQRLRDALLPAPPEGIWIVEKGSPFARHYLRRDKLPLSRSVRKYMFDQRALLPGRSSDSFNRFI